jgi:hypothetical protein
MRKTLGLIPIAALALGACSSNSTSSPSATTQPTVLSTLVLNLFSTATTDSALPTSIDNITLDTSSEDATVYTSLFASGG